MFTEALVGLPGDRTGIGSGLANHFGVTYSKQLLGKELKAVIVGKFVQLEISEFPV